ncbi:ATP-binding protein [Haloplanus halophilus]|uniref:ATP-binding protein n=1 Tax=Haloplanus halophilus TaxID=2949993 RepID=UPI00203BF582|nr:ATP-binding protein [Haloplanus sp. GDY1]
MSINILNPTGVDVATILGVLLVVDLAYAVFRSWDQFPTYGRKGRVIEAVLLTTPITWWFFAHASRTGDSLGNYQGALLLAFIAISLVFILWRITGRALYPPIAAGWLFTIPGLLIIHIVGGSIGAVAPVLDASMSDYLDATIWELAMAGGAYIALSFIDNQPEKDQFDLLNPQWDDSLPTKSASGAVSTSRSSNTPPAGQNTYGHGATGVHNSESKNHRSRPWLSDLTYDWRHSETSFDDIGGYYDLKYALREDVLKPLRAAQTGGDPFSRFGVEPERGILLYGPPGTGKTMFARALAGELDIPFVELSPADVTSMWINESSDQVKTLFSEADQIGQCVVFLDEAEHLFGAREHTAKSAHAEDRKVTSEFLAQFTRDDREAIVVSATNRPGDIDRAILRPGRLTAHFEVGLPDEEARHAILKTHLDGIPASVSGDEFAALARHTDGLTGADLANLVGQARRSAAHRNARTVTREDFPSEDALEELSAELAAENETDQLPETDADSDVDTVDPTKAKAGIRADDATGQGTEGPTRGYQ